VEVVRAIKGLGVKSKRILFWRKKEKTNFHGRRKVQYFGREASRGMAADGGHFVGDLKKTRGWPKGGWFCKNKARMRGRALTVAEQKVGLTASSCGDGR